MTEPKKPKDLNELFKNRSDVVNENDLQQMEFIELSYSGKLVPLENIEFDIINLIKHEIKRNSKLGTKEGSTVANYLMFVLAGELIQE